MSISILEKIKGSVDKIAQKAFYTKIGEALQLEEQKATKATGEAFRSLVLNKSLHTLSKTDVEAFVVQYLKQPVSEVEVSTLFEAYASVATSRGYYVDSGTIYSVRAGKLSSPLIKRIFNKFISGVTLTSNELSLLNEQFEDGFSIISTIVKQVTSSTKFSDNINRFLEAGIDLGHVTSSIQYLSNIATVSGIIENSPTDLASIYKQLNSPTAKKFILEKYREQLLASKSRLSKEQQDIIFNSIFDSQLTLIREYSELKSFTGKLVFSLTKGGSLSRLTTSAIRLIAKKTIVKVAPQNSVINQKLGREVERFYRTHLPIVYGAMLASARANLLSQDPVEMKGSKSMRQLITDVVADTVIGKPKKAIMLATTAIKTQKVAQTTGSLKTSKGTSRSRVKPIQRLRKTSGVYLSTVNLQNLMQAKLADTIMKNMRSPRLVNRTGRFAESVRVEALHYDNRNNALTAFATYMKYPYQTFEPGHAQGNESRDPRTLISASVRELAITLTTARLKAVIV